MDRSQLDILQKTAQTIAYAFGVGAVYFKFLRRKTLIPRFQVGLSGELLCNGETRYLRVRLRLKNEGSFGILIKERGTGLKLSGLDTDASEAQSAIKETITVFPAFEQYTLSANAGAQKKKIKMVEPGSIINEQKLIVVPNGKHDAFELELRVGAYPRVWWVRDRVRRATAVVGPRPSGLNSRLTQLAA